VKTTLKQRRLQGIKGIRKNITIQLNAVPLDAFNDYFAKLLEGGKKYAVVKGITQEKKTSLLFRVYLYL
jgi:hypothetical protein